MAVVGKAMQGDSDLFKRKEQSKHKRTAKEMKEELQRQQALLDGLILQPKRGI